MRKLKYSVFIPVRNAERYLDNLYHAISNQSHQPCEVLIVDSDSQDRTREKCSAFGWSVYRIDASDFNHGSTRNLCLEMCNKDSEVILFLTQDVIPENPESFSHIVSNFTNPDIALCYGRQIPHINANPLAKYSRLVNYSDSSELRFFEGRPPPFRYSMNSNAFSAYRVKDFKEMGGFSSSLILGEDVEIMARAILSGKKSYYDANAIVRHSHNYSISEEAGRYFDIGVFHKQIGPLMAKFERPLGTGKKYALGELKYTAPYGIRMVIVSFFTTLVKFLSYQLGKKYDLIPRRLRPRLSMTKGFWK